MPDKESEHRQQTRKDFDDGVLTEKKTVIPAACDGIITAMEAADRLDITEGHVFTLKRRYKAMGDAAFIHGNKGKPPKNKTSDIKKELIVNLNQTEYKDISNSTEFHRKLESEHGITVSISKVRDIFKKAGIPSGRRGGSKPGHSQPAPSKIKELDIPAIERWIKQIEAKMVTQSKKNKELQHAIGVLRDVLSAPNPTPTTVNRCILDIKKIIGELSSLTSKFSTFSKEFNIMNYEKIRDGISDAFPK